MNKYHWHCTIYTHINHIVVMMKKVILFGNVIQYCLYTNIYILLLLLLLCASSVAEDQNIILFANSTNYTCPKYLDIQQPSVFQGKFDPNEFLEVKENIETPSDTVTTHQYIKQESWNPWDVSSIFEFNYFCCPECDFSTKSDFKKESIQDFVNHASSKHPRVSFREQYRDGP